MAQPGRLLSVQHRIRRAHPARPFSRWALTRLERAPGDAIARAQERRLQLLVRFAAASSPFYRNWFREAGVDPRSIRTHDDLALLPLLDRRLLADHPTRFCTYPRRLMWPARSSGSSGAPITCYRTAGSSAYELSVLERQWGWFGLRPGARRVLLRGSTFAGDGGAPTRELPGAGQLLVSSYHLTTANLPRIVQAIRAFRPDAVEGWPSSIALLATLLREHDLTLPMRAVITSSEVMSPARVALLREVFRAPVVDHYGQTERVAMAGSCERGGYHVFPDYGIVELLPVPGMADRWEIVGTPLHNWGFPVFRYRTGDHVGPAPSDPCRCGRSFASLGSIDGRVEDVFSSSDGRLLPLPSSVVDDLVTVREAQIVQLLPGRFEVRVVPATGFDLPSVSARIRHNVDRYFGVGQHVDVRVCQALPRTAGGKVKVAAVASGGLGPPTAL